ncbi:hypothetical protein B0J11DRAFT_602593 [Dendryphion nanum]|uniref:Uncharacterized protein n=1 Tax=Dendryphion nanum TaxID=256645 RepID=A0A9P9ITD2_9PLEO|nr:hypothetical protein B0J11DRAFT_602593 [Dendryphion nanum]
MASTQHPSTSTSTATQPTSPSPSDPPPPPYTSRHTTNLPNHSSPSKPTSTPKSLLLALALSTTLLLLSLIIAILTALPAYKLKNNLIPPYPIHIPDPLCRNSAAPCSAGEQSCGLATTCWISIDVDIAYGSTVAGIILGGVGVLAAGIGMLGMGKLWRGSGGWRPAFHSPLLLGTSVVFTLLSFALTLYLHLSAWRSASTTFPPLTSLYGTTLHGPYSVETWVCQEREVGGGWGCGIGGFGAGGAWVGFVGRWEGEEGREGRRGGKGLIEGNEHGDVW